MHGPAAEGIRQIGERHVDPLKRILSEHGISDQQLEEFLLARHARENSGASPKRARGSMTAVPSSSLGV